MMELLLMVASVEVMDRRREHRLASVLRVEQRRCDGTAEERMAAE